MSTIRKASAENKRLQARGRNPALFDRLIALVDENHHGVCWSAKSNVGKDGYAILRVNGRKERAHRMMFSLYYPTESALVVRHTCNNTGCINPAHLRGGTPKDNAMDRKNSGRGGDLRGVNNGRSKLTEEQVIRIRTSKSSGADLAREFNISKVMACRIKRRMAWNHI